MEKPRRVRKIDVRYSITNDGFFDVFGMLIRLRVFQTLNFQLANATVYHYFSFIISVYKKAGHVRWILR